MRKSISASKYTYLAIILHIIISCFLASKLNVWVDECFSLQATNTSLVAAIRSSLFFDLQPPLYYILLNFWRTLDGSPFFARLLSILFTSATIYTVSKLSERHFKSTPPCLLTILIAINPLTIYVAVEIRLYSLALLCSSLLLLSFYDGFLANQKNSRARVYYFLLSILSLYTQYFLGFLLVANACVLITNKQWLLLLTYLKGMVVVAACFAPMVFFVILQMKTHFSMAPIGTDHITILEGIKYLIEQIVKYILPGHINEPSLLIPCRVLILVCGVIIFFTKLSVRENIFFNTNNTSSIITLFVILLFFLTIRNIVGFELLRSHHTIVLFIPTMLTITSIISLNKNKYILFFGFIVILTFSFNRLYYNYNPISKYGDWKNVAEYITKREKKGESIFIFRNEGILPFSLYYRGMNKIIALPKQPELTHSHSFYWEQILTSEQQISRFIDKKTTPTGRFWLILWAPGKYLNIDFHPEILSGFLKENYTLLSKKNFYGSQVKLFATE